MTTATQSKESSNNNGTIKVSKNQLPACCPPKDQAHWNQHPRVYLELSESKTASCPYCGNKFELEAENL